MYINKLFKTNVLKTFFYFISFSEQATFSRNTCTGVRSPVYKDYITDNIWDLHLLSTDGFS